MHLLRRSVGKRPALALALPPMLVSLLTACDSSGPTSTGGPTLEVVVHLSGNATDANGVRVTASPQTGPATLRDVAPGTSVTLDVAAGTYTVSLSLLDAHCWSDEPSATVVVSEGTPASVTLSVTCVGDFAFRQNDQVHYLGTDGRFAVHTFPGLIFVRGWDPMGTVVVVEDLSSAKCDLFLFDPATRAVTPVGASDFSYAWPPPVWSPTGDRLVLQRIRGCKEQSVEADEAIMLYDATGTNAIDSIPGRFWGMAWRPGTNQLTYTDATGTRLHSWTDGVDSLFVTLSGEAIAWSPDGSLLAIEVTSAEGQQIVVLDDEGDEVFRVGGAAYAAIGPRWAADGSGLLFDGARPGEEGDVYYVAADGTDERPVTTHEGPDSDPSWAPDGDFFLYTHRDAAGFVSVYLGNTLGLPRRQLVGVSGSGSPRFRPTAALGLD
jgi:Tol biopolymer transport system component